MGVFSRNRSHLAGFDSSEIIANENYVGGVGAMQMVIEGYQNDHALFEAVLGMDFQEVAALNEGVELEVFTEASISSLFDKIKEFVKKAWEKIKGIFKTFLAKLDGLIMKDNKAFVDKYRRAVTAKDLSRMKYKWADPKKGSANVIDIDVITLIQISVTTVLNDISSYDESQIKSTQEKMDDSDYLDNMLSNLVKETTDVKSFAKDYKSILFEDEEKEEGLKSSRLLEIMGVLSERKIISNLEKLKGEIDKYFTKVLKQIDNISKDITKDATGDKKTFDSTTKSINTSSDTGVKLTYNTKEKAEINFNRVNLMQKYVSTYQTAMNMIVGRSIEEVKFHIAQCRRVFAQAVSYNPKAVKENAILIEAVGEAAEYELYSLIESAEY